MDTPRLRRPSSPLRPLQAVFLAAGAGLACAEAESVTLKDAYKEHFKIGTAINRAVATGQASRRSEEQVKADVALVKAQFNQVVAENDMKWISLHPRPGKEGYDWTGADAFVEFGINNNLELAGHTLVWHSQIPNWVFEGTHLPPGPGQESKPAGAESKRAAPPPPAGAERGPGAGGFDRRRAFNLDGPRASREELLERM